MKVDGAHADPEMPWDDYIELGLGILRLAPEVFWTMTFRELRAAHDGWLVRHGHGRRRGAAPLRQELAAMMRRFPD